MNGLDTNILLRYLLQDDPVQSPVATHLIEELLTEQSPGYVCLVTMAEMVWVLTKFYKFEDSKVVKIIERLLQMDSLVLQDEQSVFTAMLALKAKQGDFGDALIVALSSAAGCTSVFTFDKKAKRLPGVDVL